MLNRHTLDAFVARLQGMAAAALGLLAIALAFVYLVPRQAEIATAMQARWGASAQTEAAAALEGIDVATIGAPASEAADEETATAPDGAASASLDPSPGEPVPGVLAAPAPETPLRLLARPVALDTGTILVGRGRVRLAGIASVPLAKKCGPDGPRGWYCGVEARTRFRAWLRSRSIACDVPQGFGQAAAIVEASCRLADKDIGEWLVSNGYAEAVPGGRYETMEAEARAKKLGVWATSRQPADAARDDDANGPGISTEALTP